MPLIMVQEKSVNDAWQVAIARVLKEGDNIKTEYDKPDDPPSKDASVIIEITDPFSYPMQMRGKSRKIKSNGIIDSDGNIIREGIKWDIYGCEADTYLVGSIKSNYIEEITEGINDHYLRDSEKSFPYSYHNRLFHYKPFALEDAYTKLNLKTKNIQHHDIPLHFAEGIKEHQKLFFSEGEDGKMVWNYRKDESIVLEDKFGDRNFLTSVNLNSTDFIIPIEFLDFPEYNQINPIVEKLKSSPYSRRCQATTWRPYSDQNHADPPCMQRLWTRIINGKLTLQTTWRSRDLFRAWEANVNGMLYIMKDIAEKVGCETGSYIDFSNSLHIYGENFKELLDVMERLQTRGTIHPELEAQIEPLKNIINS